MLTNTVQMRLLLEREKLNGKRSRQPPGSDKHSRLQKQQHKEKQRKQQHTKQQKMQPGKRQKLRLQGELQRRQWLVV